MTIASRNLSLFNTFLIKRRDILDILIWSLQGLLAAAFLMAGLGKVMGSQMHKEGFTKWRLPQWFRIVTGLVEVVAAALLIIGYWQQDLILYGALLIVATGIGGTLTHIRIKDSIKNLMPILILGILGVILTVLNF